jgi:hypothetical protein
MTPCCHRAQRRRRGDRDEDEHLRAASPRRGRLESAATSVGRA